MICSISLFQFLMNKMRKLKKLLTDVCLVLMSGIIGSLVAGIIILLSISALQQSPFVTLIVATLFLPFHFYSFRRFFRDKEWLVILGRFILMVLISSFLVGLFKAALGSLKMENFYKYLLLLITPCLFLLITIYSFFSYFLPTNPLFVRFNKNIEVLISDSKKYGIWWNY